MTLEAAVKLLDERAATAPVKGQATARKVPAATKTASAKAKAAAKKPAAKKRAVKRA